MTHPIVGIGELLWDVYPDGRKVAGGAPFNFAFHCHQLGHPAVIVSRVGNDDLGRELRERVRELGLSDEYIQTDHEHPTGTVQVSLDANAVPTYTITENVAWDFIEWDERLKELAPTLAVICHGTLALRALCSRTTIDQLGLESARAQPASRLRILDVNVRQRQPDLDLLYEAMIAAGWVKTNAEELAQLATWFHRTPSQLLQMQYQMSGEDCTVWFVTDGPNGVQITTLPETADSFHQPGVPAKVVDTVGAGDSFTAAMVCLHLEGKPLRECAKFAVHYAARVCEQPGGTPRIDRQEVERAAFNGERPA
jgi:fructokinase